MNATTDVRIQLRKFQESAPVSVMRVADELGLKVYTADSWDDDLSGMIRRDKENGGKSGYAIFVNANHPPARRRFTIAHEIGHYVLHKNLIGDGVTDDALYRSKLSSAIEAEANRFAADLLMPWHLINEQVAEGKSTVAQLADALEVSKSSMSIRLGVPYETA